MCLIDAIDSLGLGNWADIAEYVGTKTLEECREHYVQYYLNSPTYPLPSIDYKVNETLVNEMRKKRYTSPGMHNGDLARVFP